jgi:stage II sporulation protein D
LKPLLIFAFTAAILHAEITYKIRLTSEERGRIIELSAEKYVAAVLAGESSVFRSDEALKAMAVAARTYAARLRGRHASDGFDFCTTTHCQRADVQGITSRFIHAAESTSGELLWFEGKPAFSVYARDCGGKAEAVEAVWADVQAPYLRIHPDPYCTHAHDNPWSWTAHSDEIAEALLQSSLRVPQSLRKITITSRTASGRAKTLRLDGATAIPVSAGSFRFAIGRVLGWNHLRSDFYDVIASDNDLIFRGRGEGHGIGLCQRGAEQMGLEGSTYREILAFYYPGTTIARAGAGLNWTRLGGKSVALFTTRPDQDRYILALAEDLKTRVGERLHTLAPREIMIRIYPDLETFRNATGEPGWVAAHCTGARIDLQPAAALRMHGILQETLSHELLHVFIESEAAPGLPVWFREGLTEWLAHRLSEPRPSRGGSMETQPPGTTPDDADFEQRRDRARAQNAYEAARYRVAELINHYGQDAVLDWLKRGLPAEVRNSSESTATTKSK